MKRIMHHAAALFTVAACGLTACSDDPAGPGGGNGDGGNGGDGSQGFARAVVTDDPATTNGSRQAFLPAFQRSGAASEWTGSFEGRASVAISADGEAWIDVGSPATVTLDAQSSGEETDVSGEVQVPAGTYTRVRLTLEGFDARLAAGTQVGGVTLTADATVTLGGADGRVVIETTVPSFTVQADASARTDLVFDLNSEAWMNEAAVEAESVTDAAVSSAVATRARAMTRSTS